MLPLAKSLRNTKNAKPQNSSYCRNAPFFSLFPYRCHHLRFLIKTTRSRPQLLVQRSKKAETKTTCSLKARLVPAEERGSENKPLPSGLHDTRERDAPPATASEVLSGRALFNGAPRVVKSPRPPRREEGGLPSLRRTGECAALARDARVIDDGRRRGGNSSRRRLHTSNTLLRVTSARRRGLCTSHGWRRPLVKAPCRSLTSRGHEVTTGQTGALSAWTYTRFSSNA